MWPPSFHWYRTRELEPAAGRRLENTSHEGKLGPRGEDWPKIKSVSCGIGPAAGVEPAFAGGGQWVVGPGNLAQLDPGTLLAARFFLACCWAWWLCRPARVWRANQSQLGSICPALGAGAGGPAAGVDATGGAEGAPSGATDALGSAPDRPHTYFRWYCGI